MGFLEFFKGRGVEKEIGTQEQKILKLLDILREKEKNLEIVKGEMEASSFDREKRHGADSIRIGELEEEIFEVSSEIFSICQAENMDPRRFLKQEILQTLEERKNIEPYRDKAA